MENRNIGCDKLFPPQTPKPDRGIIPRTPQPKPNPNPPKKEKEKLLG